jgi:hypothetical protein
MASTPLFSGTPKVTWTGNLTSGTNTYDGTSGTTLACTAGSSGTFVRSIECEAAGTNVAPVVRVFVNNGSTTGTASNNALIYQMSLPATTASSSAATSHVTIPLNFMLQASYKLYIVIATTVSAGWQFTTYSGDY